MSEAVRHQIARCRWCGGFFVRWFEHWLCENEVCAEKQKAHAIEKREMTDGTSPFVYVPLPLQVDLETSTTKRLLMAGAAKASKSYGGRWFLYSRCRKMPGSRHLLLRCSYDELYKNHLQFMGAEAKLLGDCEYKGGNIRQMIFAELDALIFCGFCEDEGDISKHLGNDWDTILFEEGVNFLPKALSEISTRDVGSLPRRKIDPACDGRTLILTNPGGRAMRYLIDSYISKQPDTDEYPDYNPSIYGFIPAALEDNPYLRKEFADENLSGLSAARYKQLRYGDWSVVAGQFFGSFDPAIHITDAEPAA